MTDSLIRNLNMQSIANLPIWLNMAAQVYCPDKVVLVGAGNGTGPLVQGLLGLKALPTHEHLQAHLIEADPLALSQLVKKIDPECAWILSQETVVSDQTSIDADLSTYYQYSLGSESGLLPPGSLKSLWPNIQLRKKEFCANGILLSSLLPASWLLVDCLPSVQLIKGVDLGQVEVIMARVVFDEIDKLPVGSSLIELDEKLSSQGFKLFACFTERNTSIGKSLWLRDSAKQFEQSKAHGEQQAQQLSQQKSEIQQLTELKADLESKLEAEIKSRVQEVQSLKLEKDALEQDKAEVEERLEQSKAHGEQQAQQLSQQKSEIQQLTELKADLESKLEAEIKSRVQEVQSLKLEKDALEQDKAEVEERLEQSKAHGEQQAQQLSQQKSEIQQLTELKADLESKLEAEIKSRVQEVQSLKLEKDALEQDKAEVEERLEQSKAHGEQQAQQLSQQKSEIQQLTELKADLESKLEAEIKSRVQEVQSLKLEKDALEQDKAEVEERLEQSKAHGEQQAQQLSQQKSEIQQLTELKADLESKLEAEIKSRVQEVQSLKLEKDALEQDKVKLIEEIKYLQQSNAEQIQISQQLAKIEKDAQESEKRVRREVSSGLSNAVKQLESYMAIQQWTESGSAAFDFHGYPISPDLGLFLIDIVNSRSFDLIIEFGSGTSTALLAKAVVNQSLIDPNKAATRILSFEHQIDYFEKTSKILKQHGFEEIVELTYAPLIDWKDGDIGYLYYDCQTIFESLRQQYQSESLNILILIDGPPGKTCVNARYPAVPFVFEALGRHRIDLVLDDANRPDEKQTIDMWKAYLEKRSMPIVEISVPSERGIYYGVVNELKI